MDRRTGLLIGIIIGVLTFYSIFVTAFLYNELGTTSNNPTSTAQVLIPVLIDASPINGPNDTYFAYVDANSTGLQVLSSTGINYTTIDYSLIGAYITSVLGIPENGTFHWFIYIKESTTEQWIRSSVGISSLIFNVNQAMLLKFEAGGLMYP